jgi:ABC-type glycerol-3-phosphate transport system substrate-binding protein
MPRRFPVTPRCLRVLALATLALLAGACSRAPQDDRVRVVYWEKWTGEEMAAMKATVDAFNRSQDRIFVEFLSVSGIDRKTLLATAGGDPPDVAGVWVQNLAAWSDAGALEPLDPLIEASGRTVEEFMSRYEEAFTRICSYDGKIFGLPSTPASTALHWNKKLFREAGLDPERPPRTVDELYEFSKKLTKRDPATGRLMQIGFFPRDPGWWRWSFPLWFGGSLLDETGNISLATDPNNLEAFRWVEQYSDLYGADELNVFMSGFGQFGSPQYPFFAGKTAMVFQGVWLNAYMRQYAPGLDYGCAPWPIADPEIGHYTVIEADMLVIPRGAKHAKEAFEFIEYVNSANTAATSRDELRGMELLCFLQEKNSPLREWSPWFAENHPHPFIDVFRELARLPHAGHVPLMGVWEEYSREVNVVEERVRLKQMPPERALALAHDRMEESWRRHRESVDRQRRAAVRRGERAAAESSALETPPIPAPTAALLP